MKVLIAQYAGVCYGVERALRFAEQATKDSNSVYSLGPLIHNPQAVERLRSIGVEVAESVDEIEEGTLVIRSHGVAPDVIAEAKKRNLNVIDATCPHVSKAQEAAALLAEQGYRVVIVGEADHPEVAGIKAYAGDEALVVSSPKEIPARIGGRKVGVVVQTTQLEETLEEVVAELLEKASELRVFNTICSATSKRQRAAHEIAQQVDVVVVVGGHNSGNTTRLAEICRSVNPRTYHVETADELEPEWFTGAKIAGVTAGTSTPDEQMRGVIHVLEGMNT